MVWRARVGEGPRGDNPGGWRPRQPAGGDAAGCCEALALSPRDSWYGSAGVRSGTYFQPEPN